MVKKYKFHIITAGVAVLALAIAFSGGDDEVLKQELSGQKEVKSTETKEEEVVALWGVLEASDNEALGSYKLISQHGHVYIRTSRDFNSLVGSWVNVIIDGTLEDFRLLDIQASQG